MDGMSFMMASLSISLLTHSGNNFLNFRVISLHYSRFNGSVLIYFTEVSKDAFSGCKRFLFLEQKKYRHTF